MKKKQRSYPDFHAQESPPSLWTGSVSQPPLPALHLARSDSRTGATPTATTNIQQKNKKLQPHNNNKYTAKKEQNNIQPHNKQNNIEPNNNKHTAKKQTQ